MSLTTGKRCCDISWKDVISVELSGGVFTGDGVLRGGVFTGGGGSKPLDLFPSGVVKLNASNFTRFLCGVPSIVGFDPRFDGSGDGCR